MFKVIISRLAHEKINYWVQKAKEEISGLGIVEIIDGNAYVKDVMLLDQKNTSTETEIDGNAIGKAMYEFNKSGLDGDIKFWWHSHVDMPVFWSKTDMDCIENLSQHGWFISTVFNKQGQTRTAFSDMSLQSPDNLNLAYYLFYDELEYQVDDKIPQTLIDQWDTDFNEKVKEIVFKHHSAHNVKQFTLSDYKTENIEDYTDYDDCFCNTCNRTFDGFETQYFDCPYCKSKDIENLAEYNDFTGNMKR